MKSIYENPFSTNVNPNFEKNSLMSNSIPFFTVSCKFRSYKHIFVRLICNWIFNFGFCLMLFLILIVSNVASVCECFIFVINTASKLICFKATAKKKNQEDFIYIELQWSNYFMNISSSNCCCCCWCCVQFQWWIWWFGELMKCSTKLVLVLFILKSIFSKSYDIIERMELRCCYADENCVI